MTESFILGELSLSTLNITNVRIFKRHKMLTSLSLFLVYPQLSPLLHILLWCFTMDITKNPIHGQEMRFLIPKRSVGFPVETQRIKGRNWNPKHCNHISYRGPQSQSLDLTDKLLKPHAGCSQLKLTLFLINCAVLYAVVGGGRFKTI